MNPITVVFSLIGGLFLVFVMRLLSLSTVGASSPWWVYMVFLGIVFSGVMFIYTIVDERSKEDKIIEAEGKHFLEKYKRERKAFH
ncbi:MULTISPECIES: sporulation YhaL family protein [Bacillaceae]|uniref:Sporulation YhaL family protein n=1 Tax=Evansella alkalicola TaxID=745819 RepID=A0ABS6JR36_9BACI|nr:MULTISPECIES: sporulation YhaL family protein [Bacillaceae]MBU9720727.1 sporulation YhaL family protein [Bacillus alkalicola]